MSTTFAGSLPHRREGENPGRGKQLGSWTHRGALQPPSSYKCLLSPNSLTHSDGDFNIIEGKTRLLVYCQALLAGLKAAERQPTNLAKVNNIRQGERLGEESEGLSGSVSGRDIGRREADERTKATDLRPGKGPDGSHGQPEDSRRCLNQMASEERGKGGSKDGECTHLRKNQWAYCREEDTGMGNAPQRRSLFKPWPQKITNRGHRVKSQLPC